MKRDLSIFRRFSDSVRRLGLRSTVKVVTVSVGSRFLNFRPDFVQHRFFLGKRLSEEVGHKIRYGPFSGTQLIQDSRWSGADKASMLLGIYEFEMLTALVNAAEGRRVFIDVGAADGYYAIGGTASKLFEHAICFEMNPEGREIIRQQSLANGVSSQVSVLGTATDGFLEEAQGQHRFALSETVILMDIEGAEFELLSDPLIEKIKEAFLIVEIHDFFSSNHLAAEELLSRLSTRYDINVVKQGARNPNIFPELSSWNDDDRWLICSESRSQQMSWFVCRPKRALS